MNQSKSYQKKQVAICVTNLNQEFRDEHVWSVGIENREVRNFCDRKILSLLDQDK